MGQLFNNDQGKIFRVAATFDMSSNTELTLTFKDPANVETVKTKTSNGVVLGTSTITDTDFITDDNPTGELLANEYVEYPVESGLFDVVGNWCVFLTYTDTATTPDSIFNGKPVNFTVEANC